MKKLLLTLMVGLAFGLAPLITRAADDQPTGKPAPAPAADETKKKPGHVPFHGKVTAIDKQKMAVSLEERVFIVTSETKITKANKPATFGDVTVGEEIRGSYRKTEDGKMNLLSLYIGAKTDKTKEVKPKN